MDNVTLMRLIGLAAVLVIFVVTVLLMPRILGVNPASAGSRDEAVPPAPAAPVPAPATKPAAQPAEARLVSLAEEADGYASDGGGPLRDQEARGGRGGRRAGAGTP